MFKKKGVYLKLYVILQIAENVKEFFHNEGIHSTTIQPEFVEVNGQGKYKNNHTAKLGKKMQLRPFFNFLQ